MQSVGLSPSDKMHGQFSSKNDATTASGHIFSSLRGVKSCSFSWCWVVSEATVWMWGIIFKECLSIKGRICLHVVWRVLPLPLPLSFNSLLSLYPSIVFVCICVRIPGTDTRPWRVLYHWRLCACCCGKPASPTCLLRCYITLLTDISLNLDIVLNTNWTHV